MLTDKQVATLKSKDKTYKIFDHEGLYIEVLPSGTKTWRARIKNQGKEKRISLGRYPEVSLKQARQLYDSKKASESILPEPEVKRHLFKDVALEWLSGHKILWSEKHLYTVEHRLEAFIYPHIGSMEMGSISPSMILEFLRILEQEGKNETASRVKGICSQIFRYGIACAYCDSDPCRDLSSALVPVKEKHLSAITKPEDIARLMTCIKAYTGQSIVRYALYWSAYTACRPGEIRHAEWEEINWEKKLWIIPGSKMKMKREHTVPLCSQCMKILNQIQKMKLSDKWVFPSLRAGRPLSEATVLMALRNMGFSKEEMTAHGFRSMFSTCMNEQMKNPDLIEAALAHKTGDVRSVYNRAEQLEARRTMMQEWADYLDKLVKNTSN